MGGTEARPRCAEQDECGDGVRIHVTRSRASSVIDSGALSSPLLASRRIYTVAYVTYMIMASVCCVLSVVVRE